MAKVEVDPDQVRMSFGEHLDELRHSLLHAVYGLLVAILIALYYGESIYSWLMQPLVDALADAGFAQRVVASRVTTAFGLYMKIGLIVGLIIGGPWILYQLWKFVSTGLYAKERRIVILLAPFSGAMTVLSVVFLYYIILPLALTFLIGFNLSYPLPDVSKPGIASQLNNGIKWMMGTPVSPESGEDGTDGTTSPGPGPGPGSATATAPAPPPVVFLPFMRENPEIPIRGQAWVKIPEYELRVGTGKGHYRVSPLVVKSAMDPYISADEYLDFVLWMGLALAIAFQLPVVMLMLGWTGLLDPRTLGKLRKYVIFGCFAAAAVLTPTGDPFNMSLLAFPLWGLFEFGLILMRFTYRRPEGEET